MIWMPRTIAYDVWRLTGWIFLFLQAEQDFNRLSPSAGSFADFEERMMAMWTSEPVWTSTSFSQIPTLYQDPDAPLLWIVAADSEEAVTRTTPGELHSWVSRISV